MKESDNGVSEVIEAAPADEKRSEEEVKVSSWKEIVETQADEEKNISVLDEQIIRQIEYYFGDINLPKDKFLQEQIKLDDGWVPFATMFNFKRLATLTSDPEVVIAALSKSESQLMEVSEDKSKMRRSLNYPFPELNEERRKELMTRTLYLKGFPKDMSIDSCLHFFKKYNTSNICMRRFKDKLTNEHGFKGSVFVIFKTILDAENFLKESSVKFENTELVRKWQNKYLEEKYAESAAKNKKKSAKLEKQKQRQEKEEQEKQKLVLPVGAVLVFDQVPEEITKDKIWNAVSKLGGNVAFVKVEEGKAWVRLRTENAAKEILEKCTDNKITVESEHLTAAILEGDEEKQFLSEMAEDIYQRINQNKKQKYNRHSFGRKRKNLEGGPGGKKKA